MSRIPNAFTHGKAFIGFLTGGDPTLEKSEAYLRAMIRGGADLIEIGVPFSDPIAEGPVIQRANLRALAAGTTLDKLFDTVARLREDTQVPVVFLTYLNPVFRYGYPAFFARCQTAGVDGVIIPDLPFEEQGEVKQAAVGFDVDVISLVAPTSEERALRIAGQASGFVYVVSSMGVTGTRDALTADLPHLVGLVRSATSLPACVGFGIHTPEQAAQISRLADGVIVGSALVRLVEEHPEDAEAAIESYVRKMTEAILKG
ncbi:MAG: tryptophan synthase subunit alpha [Oscillospiraceae bacterium]|jgi:tryptophan synthase alpha chain|nr:tryptophan synthase subunit alpha [Oscillospiraceae bacterium]